MPVVLVYQVTFPTNSFLGVGTELHSIPNWAPSCTMYLYDCRETSGVLVLAYVLFLVYVVSTREIGGEISV